MCHMPTAGLFSKLLRKPAAPTFAVESRRIIRVESEQIPRRIMKRFREFQNIVAPLGYKNNFYATVPVIGPLAISMMSMVTSSGQNSFIVVRTVERRDGELIDGGYHGFCSFLAEDDLLMTVSPAQLPKPRDGVDRLVMNDENPETIVREHRIRMRDYDIVATDPAEVVEHIRRQNELDLRDYMERDLLRVATTGEVARIREKAKR